MNNPLYVIDGIFHMRAWEVRRQTPGPLTLPRSHTGLPQAYYINFCPGYCWHQRAVCVFRDRRAVWWSVLILSCSR